MLRKECETSRNISITSEEPIRLLMTGGYRREEEEGGGCERDEAKVRPAELDKADLLLF